VAGACARTVAAAAGRHAALADALGEVSAAAALADAKCAALGAEVARLHRARPPPGHDAARGYILD
jgi:Ser/Thr protein kinase RdoA (MazF antagonist)